MLEHIIIPVCCIVHLNLCAGAYNYSSLLYCPPNFSSCRQFAHTIAILQGDIDNMENERENFEKKLDHDTTRKGPLADLKHVSRIRTLGGPSSPYSGSSSTSQYVGRVGVAASAAATEAIGGDSGTDESMAQGVEPNPLLLSRVCQINSNCGEYYYYYYCALLD